MPKKPTRMLLPAAIPIASALLQCGCATRTGRPARPDLPTAFHFMEPGTTNTVIVPPGCRYGIWTTDKGLLYLQGLTPGN